MKGIDAQQSDPPDNLANGVFVANWYESKPKFCTNIWSRYQLKREYSRR
jgi:hypothetical protein